jgi:hypothetical protein
VPYKYNGRVLRIYTDGVHAGYARLINEDDNKERKHLITAADDDYITRHGPAQKYQLAAYLKQFHISKSAYISKKVLI